jgi:hypothetical protein
VFEKLLKQWANEQGFQTWSQDNAAVLRNLAAWLEQNATTKKQHSGISKYCNCPNGYGVCKICTKPIRNQNEEK